MPFNANTFIFIFLPITLVVFFVAGRSSRQRAALLWLVIASCLFYAWFKPVHLALLVSLVLLTFGIGVALGRLSEPVWLRRLLLFVGLGANVGALAYFKYSQFLVKNVNAVLGTSFHIQEVVLPIGISFFVFQKVAYLIDVYRGEAKEYNFLDFCLFVTFFPQLIAGPIVHHKEIIPQFAGPKVFRLQPVSLATGLTLFAIGMVKKTVFADTIAGWADGVFAGAAGGWALSFLEAWGGVLAFTFQIYFDFSAYSDMALGLALMFGVRLPVNFASPYKATSIIEFWRRWHMTLSRFLWDYLFLAFCTYLPIGKGRFARSRRYWSLLFTMCLGGLWHGAAWTFVLWGVLHGAYLVINHAWRDLLQSRRSTLGSSRLGTLLGAGLTFIAVVFSWVLFRAQSAKAALILIKSMVGLHGVALPKSYAAALGWFGTSLSRLGVRFDDVGVAYCHGLKQPLILAGLFAVVWLLPNSTQWLSRFSPAITQVDPLPPESIWSRWFAFRLNAWMGAAVALALGGAVLYQAVRTTPAVQFIYFQF